MTVNQTDACPRDGCTTNDDHWKMAVHAGPSVQVGPYLAADIAHSSSVTGPTRWSDDVYAP